MATRRDWLLVALSEADEAGLSPVQVQKAMFLFRKGAERTLDPTSFYNFEPYNFGPFDAAIYRDLDHLHALGLVKIIKTHDENRRLYQITSRGKAVTEEFSKKNRKISEYIGSLVRWVESKSFEELVRFVYRKWPEYKAKSIFKDRAQA